MLPGQRPGEPLEEGLARAEATEAVSIFPATSTSPCSPGLEAGAFPTPNHQPDDGQRPNATHGGEGGGMQIQQGCGGAGGGDSPAPEAGHSAPDLLRRRHLLSWRLAFLIPGLQSSKGDSNSKANTTPWAGSGCRAAGTGLPGDNLLLFNLRTLTFRVIDFCCLDFEEKKFARLVFPGS